MKITATFVGKDASYGYSHGARYTLVLDDRTNICIEREDGSGRCPYQSLGAFLRDWSDIKLETT